MKSEDRSAKRASSHQCTDQKTRVAKSRKSPSCMQQFLKTKLPRAKLKTKLPDESLQKELKLDKAEIKETELHAKEDR